MRKYNTIYRLVGTFNNRADIHNLFDLYGRDIDGERVISASDVADYIESGKSIFFHEPMEHDKETDLILEDEDLKWNSLSRDRKYLVLFNIDYNEPYDGTDFDENDEDMCVEAYCDSYIDVYEFDHIDNCVDYNLIKEDVERNGYGKFILKLDFAKGGHIEHKFTDFDAAFRELVFQYNRDDMKSVKLVGVIEGDLFDSDYYADNLSVNMTEFQ